MAFAHLFRDVLASQRRPGCIWDGCAAELEIVVPCECEIKEIPGRIQWRDLEVVPVAEMLLQRGHMCIGLRYIFGQWTWMHGSSALL